jgi:hypothetical protein
LRFMHCSRQQSQSWRVNMMPTFVRSPPGRDVQAPLACQPFLEADWQRSGGNADGPETLNCGRSIARVTGRMNKLRLIHLLMLPAATLMSCNSRTDSEVVAIIEAKCGIKNVVSLEHNRGDTPWNGWSAIRENQRISVRKQLCVEKQTALLGYNYRHRIAPPNPGSE